MQYSTFYWEHLAALAAPDPLGRAQRTINANSLHSQIRNGYETKIFIMEVSWGSVWWDNSANTASRSATLDFGLALQQTLDNPRASENLTMTIVNPQDANTPGGSFLFINAFDTWYGKILMPEQFTVAIYGSQPIVFGAGDILASWMHIGYDVETKKI